jgi:Zn-dependent protease/CBS domain-containing protein
MQWSWKIGRVFGIQLQIHATFWLLLAWVVFAQFMIGRGMAAALAEVIFVILLFGIVVLHELGHALTARAYGIRTRDITLLPIGGVARLERIPEKPLQELAIAVAGPAVNVVLAAVLFVGLQFAFGPLGLLDMLSLDGGLLEKLFWVNVVLAVFNLLPAFPMDGGRVLRALLALNMNYARATRIAATVGMAMAVLFGVAGFFGIPGFLPPQPFLVLVAFFVWAGAWQENQMVQMRFALGNVPVREIMVTEFGVLHPQDTLAAASHSLLGGFQQDFPVVDQGKLVGLLTRGDLIRGMMQHGSHTPIGEVMRRQFPTANPWDSLHETILRGGPEEGQTIPVVHNGQLVGILTLENVGEFLSLRQATEQVPEEREVRR